MSDSQRKQTIFWSLVSAWVATDVITKAMAVSRLQPRLSHEVYGEWVRFTLVFNQGAAFGMHIGGWSRWIFTALTLAALAMLAHLYRESRANDYTRIIALALVTAGAIGNLVDRLRSARGVVDFIDVGTRSWRFWTFNVADVGVSCGAVLLAIVLWNEERHRQPVLATSASADIASSDAAQSPPATN